RAGQLKSRQVRGTIIRRQAQGPEADAIGPAQAVDAVKPGRDNGIVTAVDPPGRLRESTLPATFAAPPLAAEERATTNGKQGFVFARGPQKALAVFVAGGSRRGLPGADQRQQELGPIGIAVEYCFPL